MLLSCDHKVQMLICLSPLADQDKPSAPPVQGILELNRDDIEIETKLETKINNSKYYKGTLHKFPVAIKRFDNVGFSNVE